MTTFSNKCDIVADFYLEYRYDYPEVISNCDLGFPLAVAFVQGGVNALTAEGIGWINESYDAVCEALGIDKYGDYGSLSVMLEFAESYE